MAALTVPTIFTAVDKLSSVVSKMQGNISKFSSETEKKYANMSRRAQQWQTNFSQVGMAAGIAGAAIVAPLGLAVKAATDFEDQMANVATLVDTSKESIKDMGKQVLEVFTKAPVKLDDLTEALYKIRSAGIPAAQAMDVLSKSAVLGIAGRGTTLQAGDAITSAMNVFKDEGLSTNKIASMLFETVKQGKTTIEGMSESFGATANIVHNGGVKLKDFLSATAAMTVMGEPATQAMNQIRASVFGLEKPTTRMKFLFKELGVKDVHGLINKFGNLGNAMSAIEDKGKKLGVNMGQAWGKVGAYAAVIALTGNSKDAYNKNLVGMNNSDADLAAAYALKLMTMKSQAELLHNQLQVLGITVGTALMPSLKSLAEFLIPIVRGFAQWIEDNPGLAGGIIKTTAAIGGLLVIISPLAFAISGVLGLMKLWAGYQLLVAEKAATVAAALVTEGTAVAGIAGEFAIAETAAVGFFATLSEFVLPAALLALAGLALYKVFKTPGEDSDLHKYYHKNLKDINLPFYNPKEEEAYQTWVKTQYKPIVPGGHVFANVGNRASFDRDYGKQYEQLPIIDTAVIHHLKENTAKSNGVLDIHLHDKGNNIDTLKMTGHLNIPTTLNQKSTGPLK